MERDHVTVRDGWLIVEGRATRISAVVRVCSDEKGAGIFDATGRFVEDARGWTTAEILGLIVEYERAEEDRRVWAQFAAAAATGIESNVKYEFKPDVLGHHAGEDADALLAEYRARFRAETGGES